MSQHQRNIPIAAQDSRLSRGQPNASDFEVAKTLIGVTAEDLARQIGALPAQSGMALAVRPVLDLDRLVGMLRTVSGWYADDGEDGYGEGGPRPALLAGADETDADAVLRDFLRLHADWESRQAMAIAARLATPADSEVPEPRPNMRPRALLVDDASDILIVVGAFLASYGFTVARAADGDAAMAVLADGKPVDLLVTDYAMPNITGLGLATMACEQHPELAVLIISGHPDCHELACLPPNVRLLAKPFRRAQLYEHVRALVRGHHHMRELV